MTKPLSLFIRPPYDAWTTKPRLSYGDNLPPTLSNWGAMSEFLLLETTQPEIPIYATATGYISTRFPEGSIADPQEELIIPTDLAIPDQINIYLKPDPIPDQNYHAKAHGLPQDEAVIYPGDLNPLQFFSNPIGAFYYINLDTESLKTAVLSSLPLELVGLPGLATLPLPILSLLEQKWLLFLTGQLDIPVTAGMPIGHAGNPLFPVDNNAAQHIGFTVFSRSGTHDPAHFYDFMREFVVDEPDINAFLVKVPKRWPLIQAGMSKQEIIDKTAEKIYPYEVLKNLRKSDWTQADWRRIGDNQKALYRRRLLVRVGKATPNIDDPPFMFNNLDWKNIFQLEAVVEFYMNYDDPWQPNSEPQEPAPQDRIDFLPLKGSAAILTPSVVDNKQITQITLDGQPDMEKIWVGRDIIVLTGSGETEAHRIIDANLQTNKVTVAANVNTGNNPTWHIKHRPILVIVDSFGGRLEGKTATISGSEPRVLKLDGVSKAQITRIRENFTTIYLYADTAHNSIEPHTYRITNIDVNKRLVTLDEEPEIPVAGTAWMIPAGIGGQLPNRSANLTKKDDYDAVLFVVDNGEIKRRYRWSSFTSRRWTNTEHRSSVRGNRKYYIAGIKSTGSGKKFRNFSMMVTDDTAYIWGSGATEEPAKTINLPGEPDLTLFHDDKPYFLFLYNDSNQENAIGGYWIQEVNDDEHTVELYANPSFEIGNSSYWRLQLYDGIHEARRYFISPVTADNAEANEIPNGQGGKRLIRLHYGFDTGNYSASQGCIVSPDYYTMRNFLITLYQDEYQLLHGVGEQDDEIAEVSENNTHTDNKSAYDGIDASQWHNKIVGTLWLIRPDERPLG